MIQPTLTGISGSSERDPRDVAGLAGKPSHPAPSRDQVSPFLLWFGLFGAAAAWSVQLIANYAIAAHGCFPRLVPLTEPVFGQATLTLWLVAISIFATVVGALAVVAALVSWRRTSDETGGEAHWLLETGEGRTRFMAAAGMMASSVFLLAIIFHFAVVVLLGHC
ncbi:MAG: hypothetical protein ABI035_12570 [Gemmatimonadaceae bacterium]